MIITKKFSFEAAHKLINYEGDCANLHGHSYKIHISISGEVNPNGFVIDFKEIKQIVNKKIIDKLDHSNLNEKFKQPTAENIVIWIWNTLTKDLNLHEIKLYETEDSFVTYNGK